MSYDPSSSGAVVAINDNRNMHRVNIGKSPVYAIDFSAVACGARIASTKRKIRWRFGFTNLEALDAGLTGQECRGEEHEISLVWSITSGKRVVHVDNQEVHYSNNRSSTFEFSWTMRGNHVLKVIAHASAPITATQGFRQYNFFVDGLSFFNFPKVYRLNIPGRESNNYMAAPAMIGDRGTRAPYGEEPSWKLEEPRTEQEEEAILKEIIEESLKEKEKAAEKEREEREAKEKSSNTNTSEDLLDFFSVPAVTTNAQGAVLNNTSMDPQSSVYNQAPAYTKSSTESGYPIPQQNSEVAVSNSTTPSYAVPTPTSYQYTPAPTPLSYPVAATTSYNALPPSTHQSDENQLNQLVPEEKATKSGGTPADQAYLNIANDFSLLSTDKNSEGVRSNPFDAPASTSVPQPTLEGLKSMKTDTEKKEVMKNSGAMVVANNSNQQGNWGGFGTSYVNPSGVNGAANLISNQAAYNTNVQHTALNTQTNAFANYSHPSSYSMYQAQQSPYNHNNFQSQYPTQQNANMQSQHQNQPAYYQQYQPTQP